MGLLSAKNNSKALQNVQKQIFLHKVRENSLCTIDHKPPERIYIIHQIDPIKCYIFTAVTLSFIQISYDDIAIAVCHKWISNSNANANSLQNVILLDTSKFNNARSQQKVNQLMAMLDLIHIRRKYIFW